MVFYLTFLDHPKAGLFVLHDSLKALNVTAQLLDLTLVELRRRRDILQLHRMHPQPPAKMT